MSEQAAAVELQPTLPFGELEYSYQLPPWTRKKLLENPPENLFADSPELSFGEELRRAPFVGKMRLAVALGLVGLTAAAGARIGVQIMNRDETAARAVAAQNAAQLSSCLDYIQTVTGPEPKVVIAEDVPSTIRDDCGITEALERAKNSNQFRGVIVTQPYEVEVEDVSGAAVKLPSEASVEDQINRFQAEAADHNPVPRILIGGLTGLLGLFGGVTVVSGAAYLYNGAQSKRREIEMKNAESR